MSIRELSRVDHEHGESVRTVQTYEHGVRAVTVSYGGESWHRYVIVPRQLMIDRIRRLRANGRSYHDCDWWTLIPSYESLLGYEHYSGPGRSFADAPHPMGYGRRWQVFAQRGGMDV